ncbi:MAG: ribonuclease P protein component [Bifidobacteriaceae bacterium]|jgi:ribonuclease P protein component|nr:ribonuclease P protein component [Bifidobacteriaceae bacterium]
MLAQAHRLRRSADFSSAMRRGRRCGSRLAVVYVAAARATELSDAAGSWRAGLVVSKAVGNSVVRHRVARRLRHILASELPKTAEARDVVVRALGPAASADYKELERAVGKCLRQAA